MFAVFIFRLACIREELQGIADRRRSEIQNMEDVMGALQSLSGMEEVLGTLQKKKEELWLQHSRLLEMIQGLEELRQRYQRTEERICGNKEAQMGE